MSRQVSPFAALSGAEKQIKWLEYQSVRLPYIQAGVEAETPAVPQATEPQPRTGKDQRPETSTPPVPADRPQPPPEVPRTFQTSKHTQYDAVIARMKQAELQSQKYQMLSKSAEQPH